MADVKLGPDGLPEPVGNETQRLVGKLVAATFNEDVANSLVKSIQQSEVQVSEDNKPVVKLTPEQAAVILGQAKKEGELPVVNPEIKAQGKVTPPADK